MRFAKKIQTQTIAETPAWGAVIAAIVLGILAALGFMRGESLRLLNQPLKTHHLSRLSNLNIRIRQIKKRLVFRKKRPSSAYPSSPCRML